ncbi:MAG: hypothetical protein ACRCX2_08750 [Paraclostridium sp.]
MTNYIFQDLKTSAPNCKLEERLLQGTTNRTFAFTLFDRGKQSLLDPTAKITVIALYNPRVVNGVFMYDGSFALNPSDTGYNVTVRETQIDEKFSIIYVPFRDEYVSYAGKCEFILKIEENGINTYTYSMEYNVDRNDAYFNKSIPNNLPSFSLLQKQIADMQLNKANKTLDNVDNAVFKAKAISSGIGKAETAAQIKAMMESAPDAEKFDYKKALTGKPTGVDFARALEGVQASDKMSYTAIKDMPNPVTVLLTDMSNANTAKLNEAIEGTDSGKQIVDNTRAISDKASKDLSDVDDKDFESKAKASNFAQNNLADIDIQKLNEKGKVAGLIESVRVGETHGNYNQGDVKELQFHNDLDVTIDNQNKVATISLAPTIATNDMAGISAQTLSDKIKLTNAYQDLINKGTHPATTGITIDDVKKLFEANFYEETSSVDLSSVQFNSLTLFMQYQMTSNNQVITQQLPPVSQNKIVMVSKVDSIGITGTTLTIVPAQGDMLNGANTPISFGSDKSGYVGYFLPLINQNGYEFIPHEVSHDFGIAISDDKNNVIIGRNSIQFKKSTISESGNIVIVTPDVNSGGGGINGIGVIDSGGASTTDVTVIEFPQATIVGDGSGKATITIPSSGQGGSGLKFKTNSGSEFNADEIFSIDKSIEFVSRQENGKNVAGILINPELIPSQHNEGIHACLGNMQLLNSMYPKEKMYFGDIRCKGGKFVYADMNTKSFVIQDVDPQDDPNVSGGTTFLVAMYFDPSIENASITQDGSIEIQLVDDNDVVLKNTDGLPVTALIKYKAGDIPKPELYIGEIQASAFTRVHMKVKLNFPTEEIIYAGPNTQLCLQAINAYESSGIALLSFMLFTGYRFGFETKYYGYNSINLSKFLLFDRPQSDVPADSTVQLGENFYINFKSKGKAEITGNKLILQDNGTDLPVFSISKLYTPLDCAYLGDKNMKITVKITNKEGAFIVGMLEYTGKESKPPIPFVTSYNNSNPIFTNGWVKRDELFIVEDPTKDEHTETKDFQLPKDAQGIAFIIYPMDTVSPCKLTLGDFEGDITPWFTKTIISSNSHIKEMQLYDKDVYKFATYTPSEFRAYRMTANKADTKLGIGKNFSVGNTLSSKAWDVIEGVDPDKVQSDLIANKDGKGFMQYTVRAFNDSATDNDLIVFLGKKNPDNTYTEVYQSRLTTTIGAHTSTPQILSSTEFELDFKSGDIFRLFMKSNVDDGFYLQSDTDGVPLSIVKISVNEMSAIEAKIVDLDLRANEVKFVDGGQEVFNKILQYDVQTGKMTVVDKAVI